MARWRRSGGASAAISVDWLGTSAPLPAPASAAAANAARRRERERQPAVARRRARPPRRRRWRARPSGRSAVRQAGRSAPRPRSACPPRARPAPSPNPRPSCRYTTSNGSTAPYPSMFRNVPICTSQSSRDRPSASLLQYTESFVMWQGIAPGAGAAEIAARIEAAIAAGALAPGARLPTVRELATDLSVSPATVAAAYRTLKQRGLVSANRRRGTVVAAQPPLRVRARRALPPSVRDLAGGNPDPALLPPLAPALAALAPAAQALRRAGQAGPARRARRARLRRRRDRRRGRDRSAARWTGSSASCRPSCGRATGSPSRTRAGRASATCSTASACHRSRCGSISAARCRTSSSARCGAGPRRSSPPRARRTRPGRPWTRSARRGWAPCSPATRTCC